MGYDSAKIEEKEIAQVHYVRTKMVQKKINKQITNQIHAICVLNYISKVFVHLKVRFVISVENQDT